MIVKLQWKLGFGKTLGLHLEYAGLGFDAFKDWGTYSVGHNSIDGSINEWSKGQGWAISFLGGQSREEITATTTWRAFATRAC